MKSSECTLDRLLELRKTNGNVRRIFSYQNESMDVYMEFYGLIGADLRRSKYLDWDKGISAFAKNGFDEILKLLKQESEIKIGGADSVRNGEVLEYVFSLSNQTSDVNFFSIRSDVAEYALDEKNDGKNSSDVKCVWRYGKWNKKDNAVAIPLSGSKEVQVQ